jgi:S1-C subfamily serine protease
MFNAVRVLAIISICSTAFTQTKPLTQKEACREFDRAIIRIDTGRPSHGTGFIVSPDGWIFTAAHVVFDGERGKNDEAISVTLPDGSIKLATQVLPIEPNMAGRDYALLKVEGVNLPSLDLGDKPEELVPGSDLTIIGFPFSAVGFQSSGPSVKDKFCLSGTIAYSGPTSVPITVVTSKGPSTVNVNVDVVYFQGPSVQGLSGSPIISRDTGRVIAILTSKLTGISEALARTKQDIEAGPAPGIRMEMIIGNKVPLERTLSGLITVMDQQLANGLGAGTGIEDAKAVLRHILRSHKADQK